MDRLKEALATVYTLIAQGYEPVDAIDETADKFQVDVNELESLWFNDVAQVP